jgi:hypothetical protein
MDENPYESPAEPPDEPLVELEPEPPPRPQLALRIKRITQVIAFCCAMLFFLLNARVLPPQRPIVGQLLFGGAMLGLLVIIGCNYFTRPKGRPRVTPQRLRLK